MPVKARHYGISTRLPEAVLPAKGLALQYELKLSEGLTCGGAYLKFVSDSKEFDPSSLKEATPYTVMFGADKCGSTNKASDNLQPTFCCKPLQLVIDWYLHAGSSHSPTQEAQW